MKKSTLFLATLSLYALASCSTTLTQNDYQISGTVNGALSDGAKVFLSEVNSSTMIDSAEVKSGKFEMSGSCENPNIMWVISGRERRIVTTGSEANVTVGDSIVVEQGDESRAINELSDKMMVEYNEFTKFCREHRDDRDAQYSAYNQMNSKMATIEDEYLKGNNSNLIGAYVVMSRVNDTKSISELDSIVNVAPLAANLEVVKNNRKQKENAEKTAVGKPFVDFDCSDIDGNSAKLSDYVGKGSYVLVDFWASWCGPCRAEMPNIKNVYEKYGARGLVVLGVNVWDNLEKCKVAIEEEGMSWNILYASANNSATDSYGILGIPTIILFAPDGTIVNRTIRGAAIMECIDEIYSK